MTLQTFSDTFTFNYTFKDFDTAQVAGHALMGYVTGTFEQPVIEVYYDNDKAGGYMNRLSVEYAADAELVEVFKRICDSFKDYYNNPEDLDEYEQEREINQEYISKRMEQLRQSESFESLLEKVAKLELELLDYAERLLNDDPIPMDFMTAYDTLDLVGAEAIELLKTLDKKGEYSGLVNYDLDSE
ncbi:TPA: hypothetical protein ACGO3A_002011 [Streptococcus suis]